MADRSAAVTLAEVAARAGVSIATASRVLNGSERTVRQAYVDRVLLAAEELRYSANVQAQAVARGTSSTVSLIVGDVADPYFASIAAGAIRAADDAGLVLNITVTGGDPERERTALTAIRGQRPRAVVVAASRWLEVDNGRALADLVHRGIGVTVLTSDQGTSSSIVLGLRPLLIGNHSAATELARQLVDLGHDDFLVLGGDRGLETPVARALGFAEGLKSSGIRLPEDRLVWGAFSRDGGYEAMTDLLLDGVRPGCVFAVTDVMAVGAMAAIREHGLRPGVDIGVAGFDDVRMLADIVPALTTVRIPLEEIGARAVRVALGQEPTTPIAGEVVLRASTARLSGPSPREYRPVE